MTPRPNLDFLRTLAVATVLIDHTALALGKPFLFGWDAAWLGVFGVYLFFVHTSLVLMWSLERRPHTLDFYVRRVFRIYPLAVLAVVVVAAFRLPLLPGPLTAKMLFANLLLMQNVLGQASVMGVLWSLPLEVQMYLVLPMLFLFARRERVLWPFLLFWCVACRLAISTGGHPMGNSLNSAVSDFLPGVFAYIGFKHRSPRWPGLLFPVFLLALCALFERAPGVERGWFVCLSLGLALPFFRDLTARPVVAVSHTVAKYSYGIYLLHPFALLVAFTGLKGHALWLQLSAAGLCLWILSFFAYHLVEHPMVKLGSRIANRLQTRFGTDYRAEYGLDLA